MIQISPFREPVPEDGHAFLQGRSNLARVYLLIDARHGLKATDDDVLATLDRAAVNYQVVLTKADEVKAAGLAALGHCRGLSVRGRAGSVRRKAAAATA